MSNRTTDTFPALPRLRPRQPVPPDRIEQVARLLAGAALIGAVAWAWARGGGLGSQWLLRLLN